MKKILLVEDQRFLLNALTDTLTKEGFQILQAQDGAVGLDSAIKNHPDLILLDIIMPVMDGLTMLKKLRQDSWGKTANVIMLTNLDNPEALETGQSQNVSDYLIKSDWKLEDLVKICKKTLDIK